MLKLRSLKNIILAIIALIDKLACIFTLKNNKMIKIKLLCKLLSLPKTHLQIFIRFGVNPQY